MFDEDIVWETLEEDLERVSSQKSVDDAAAGRVLARRMEKDEFEVEFRTMEDEYFTCFVTSAMTITQAVARNKALREELGRKPRDLYMGEELVDCMETFDDLGIDESGARLVIGGVDTAFNDLGRG